MPAASHSTRAVFTHGEGESTGERFYKIRIRSGKVSVSVKRSAGTATGKLTVYRSNGDEADRSRLESKTWGDTSSDVVADTAVTSPFIVLGADFTSSDFGQVEVLISNS